MTAPEVLKTDRWKQFAGSLFDGLAITARTQQSYIPENIENGSVLTGFGFWDIEHHHLTSLRIDPLIHIP
jgi:hypothetical protein